MYENFCAQTTMRFYQKKCDFDAARNIIDTCFKKVARFSKIRNMFLKSAEMFPNFLVI